MPLYRITTHELWPHEVRYEIEAPTLKHALTKLVEDNGDCEYDTYESMGDGDVLTDIVSIRVEADGEEKNIAVGYEAPYSGGPVLCLNDLQDTRENAMDAAASIDWEDLEKKALA